MFTPTLVGLPGLFALALGFVGFIVALAMARARGTKSPPSTDAGRRNASIIWIIVQGLGIGLTGIGRLRVQLDPWSPRALAIAAVVLALMGGAVWLFDASSRAMGRNWGLVARTRGDGTLVQTGPFAVVRNPIYVALFLLMLAMAVAYGHTAQLIVAVPVFAFGTWMRVVHEERVLRETFGAAFDAYRARVKRFVPGVL